MRSESGCNLSADSTVAAAITAVCEEVRAMLILKNRAYGNSALEPLRVFARHLGPLDQILVRIDDKLSRIARGSATAAVPEDTILDLIGYLVLLRVAGRVDDVVGGLK